MNYTEWAAERARLGTIEGETGEFDPDAMQALDDEAVDLLHGIVAEAAATISDLMEAWGDHAACYGVNYTCTEATSMYDFLIFIGQPALADQWMRIHASCDEVDEGDLHMEDATDPRGWRLR